jgi:hypothetical protein
MKKYTLFIVLAASLVLSSCKDFLTQVPLLTQSNEKTMSNYVGLNKATAGAYAVLSSEDWYGGMYVLNAEMRTGNGKRPAQEAFQSGRMLTPYTLNYADNSTEGLWGTAYYAISAANNVLDNLTGKVGTGMYKADNTTLVTGQDTLNLKAECLFIRAIAHFDMVRLYAQPYSYKPDGLGIPIVLHTDPSGKPARNTVAEVYNQVVKDLLEAEGCIDPNYRRDGGSDAAAYVNIWTIRALLSRVYLYMGEWQKSADYATKVIESGQYTMWTADQVKSNVFTENAASSEVIFEMFGDIGNGYDPYWESTSYMTNPAGYADCAACNDLISLYSAGDVRGTLFTTVDDAKDTYWTTKYAGKGLRTPDVNNVIILRLSEMYLNRAEAQANGAQVSGATIASDINMITSNRGAAAISSPGKEDIFNEERKEFAWEGHYWFDLARTKRSMTRSDFTGTDKTSQNLDFPSYKWALPIAKRELSANENLVQNEGY